MIRLVLGRKLLLERLGTRADGWEKRAGAQTARNAREGRHVKLDNLWTELLPALVELQHRKCAYCEGEIGENAVEWTVDHHRPRGRVRAGTALPESTVDTGGAAPTGYHLLAYEPDNFLGACGTCNNRKADYFPTAAARALTGTDREALHAERAYLIDPAELDPEDLITWRGVVPVVRDDLSPHDRLRALITLDLLDLARPQLVRDRAYVLLGVWMAHHDDNVALLDALCAPSKRFSACARAFRELLRVDPDAARTEYDLAAREIVSG